MVSGLLELFVMKARVLGFVSSILAGIKNRSLLVGTIDLISFLFAFPSGSEGLSSTDLKGLSEGRNAEKWGKRDFILCKL